MVFYFSNEMFCVLGDLLHFDTILEEPKSFLLKFISDGVNFIRKEFELPFRKILLDS